LTKVQGHLEISSKADPKQFVVSLCQGFAMYEHSN